MTTEKKNAKHMEKNWCKITVKKDIFFEAAKKMELKKKEGLKQKIE